MTLRRLARAGLLLLMCSVSACGCGDDSGGNDNTAGTGKDDDSAVPFEKDAGPTVKPRKDAAAEMDATVEAGLDAWVDPFPQDATTVYASQDAGPAPDTWLCMDALWADGICDCGCGDYDADCLGSSCKEPGCILSIPGCQACFNSEHAWTPCGEPPSVDDWTCTAAEMSNDGICDCGCGIQDPTCGGSGCVGEGCYVPACQRRHGADVDDNGFADPLALSSPPPGWTCAKEEFGGGDGCDCGCGVEDPDCGGGPNCLGPKCTADSCQFCHDAQGRRLQQCSLDLAAWTCDPRTFGAGDGCDCGCGIADPDCMSDGCEGAYCRDNACKRCTDADHGTSTLVGCTPQDDTWKCDASHYGTGDGCDCGCGITDPDCNSKGCTDPGCTDAVAKKCDYCHAELPDGGTATDSPSEYIPCGGWTCGADTDAAWTDLACDCGCGKPDPACRALDREGCTGANCQTPVCQYCNDGTSTGRATCTGDQWSGLGYCSVATYGLDGLCDCGCGGIDADCAAGQGCADGNCAADGCTICHSGSGKLVKCHEWNCDDAAYADGQTCDCGCGADDPDCEGLGCKEPGCRRQGICEQCHDLYGRPTECP